MLGSFSPKDRGRLRAAEVYARIIKKRLYKARPEFGWLREQAYKMLDPKRIPHVQGLRAGGGKACTSLGRGSGDAVEAAILHDITKNYCLIEQLLLCERYGIIIDSLEAKSTKLLHAKTMRRWLKICLAFQRVRTPYVGTQPHGLK